MDRTGILVIDKPTGITSHGVVKLVKMKTGARKVGHMGTLDPLATGVLPLCMDRATKAARFLDGGVKEYSVRVRLGVETDTYDAEGKVVARADYTSVDEENLKKTASRFEGRIKQVPPMFSAVKKGGVPLYKLARKGITIEREPKEVDVVSIEVTKVDLPFFELLIVCSKGTYVRSICHDIGRQLGCGAHMVALRRVRSGQFTLDDSIGLEGNGKMMVDSIKTMEDVFQGLPEVPISKAKCLKASGDCSFDKPLHRGGTIRNGTLVRFTDFGKIVAIGVYNGPRSFKIEKVFS